MWGTPPQNPSGVAGEIKKKIGWRFSYTQLDSQQVWVWGEQEEQESRSWIFWKFGSLWAAEASLLQARVRVGVGVGVGDFKAATLVYIRAALLEKFVDFVP